MVVPRRQIGVAYWPIDGDAIARIRLKVHLTPAIALTTPGDGAAADMVAANPVKPLFLRVGIVQLVHEPMLGRLRMHIPGSRRDRLMAQILCGGASAIGQLPGIEPGCRIIAV